MQNGIAQTVAGLFAGDVAVGVTDPRGPQPGLLAGEGGNLARAIEKRQREFAAGRAAARLAMAQLGGAAVPIPAGSDRAPLWPEGWRGSISHSSVLCAAVVTRGKRSLGIDLELATPLDEKLLSSICSADEISDLNPVDKLLQAKLVFSAKEAAYKAQYPLTAQVFGFHHLRVALDPARTGFTATFLRNTGPFALGSQLSGRYALVADHVVTAVSIDLVSIAES